VVDAFLELDTSRRGTIRLHELRDVLQRFDIPDQEPVVDPLWMWIYHEWDIP
jgi:Ca2+-binding EF-hand superfamily protein